MSVKRMARLFDQADGPFTLMISSPGGDVDAAMAMHELMRLTIEKGAIISTIGTGAVISAAVLLLTAGSQGHRTLTKFSRLMYHESFLGEISGTASAIGQAAQALKDYDKDFDGLIAGYTGMSLAQVRRLYANGADRWMDADEALKLGFIDNLI